MSESVTMISERDATVYRPIWGILKLTGVQKKTFLKLSNRSKKLSVVKTPGKWLFIHPWMMLMILMAKWCTLILVCAPLSAEQKSLPKIVAQLIIKLQLPVNWR